MDENSTSRSCDIDVRYEELKAANAQLLEFSHQLNDIQSKLNEQIQNKAIDTPEGTSVCRAWKTACADYAHALMQCLAMLESISCVVIERSPALAPGDWVRTDTGLTGEVYHVSKTTAFVDVLLNGGKEVLAFPIEELIKSDPPILGTQG